jgi:uncharacterized protein
MFYFDPVYLLIALVTVAISGAAQAYIQSAYSKWGKVRNGANLAGPEVAARIEQSAGLSARVERVPGQLTDHFDPRSNTVRLSDGVATQPSIASMAITAHELGHAQQYAQGSLLISARSFLLPAVQISPTISYGLLMAGFLFNATGLIWIGILFFGVSVLFMLLTLPVEIDASRRALVLLDQAGLMVTEQDRQGARNMLTAAALTYVAAAVTAILQLLYLISRARRN